MIDDRPPRVAWEVWKRFLIGSVLVVLLTASATATAGLLQVKEVADIFSQESTPIRGIQNALDDVDPGDPQTILVLGSDRRYIDVKQGNPTRSDTLILVRLDPNREATAVLSIPRDLKVDIDLGARGIVTDKINAAYAYGGPKLAVKTVKKLLGIEIHHVVNVNFGGFKRAVNRIGCVYADVDRRYFNDNSGPGPDYASIDLKPGYQKLCGQDALDYVRYRHEDTDLVRAARQQDFLRQAKQQVGVGRLFSDRRELTRIFARYTQTDIRSNEAILRLLKLAFLSASHPIREVHFRGEAGETYVTTTPEQIRRMVGEFLNARASKGPRGRPKTTSAERRELRRRKKRRIVVAGLVDATRDGEDQAISAATKLRFPVYFPRLRLASARYADVPRTYDLYDDRGRRRRAYRMVLKKAGVGEFYGVQGMTWKDPPILKDPSEKRRMDGRTFELFFDGDRLRLVAWRTDRAVYWVSNTLSQTLTNKQMLAIARSLTRIGQKG